MNKWEIRGVFGWEGRGSRDFTRLVWLLASLDGWMKAALSYSYWSSAVDGRTDGRLNFAFVGIILGSVPYNTVLFSMILL